MKRPLILGLFVAAKFILQFFAIHPVYELHRDEYLHLNQADHLAWGYLSVPPVTSWISLIIKFLGNGEFWVKFFPALFGALTLFVVWKIIETLKGNLFALILGATGILFSVLMRLNTLFQPNSLEYLLWTTTFYFLIKYIQTEKNKLLYLTAITMAFGFLNKYNIVFLLLGLIPAIILTKRSIFKNKHLYLSILVALIIISPNLWWQYDNSFPVFIHLEQLSRLQLANVSLSGFISEQILFFFGSIFVIIAAFIGFIKYEPFKKFRFVPLTFIFSMGLFIYNSAKGYYTIGLYPVLIAYGSVYLGHLLSASKFKILKPALVCLSILITLPILYYALPFYRPETIINNSAKYEELGLLRWEDGKNHHLPQDYADMLGWKELAHEVDSAWSYINDPDNTMVLCDNYGQAGAVNYYSKFDIDAVTFNADYLNWFDLTSPVKNVILVKFKDDKDPNRERERNFFDEVFLSGKINNEMAREYNTSIWVLKGAKIDVNSILQEELDEEKEEIKYSMN
ncbi:glycosyltransferase family 39 protein [Marinigracilibium pacificum]|uniref:Glycosyltransferase family 39 protein n=1 Tax=Marinigracilibium pacificum TaxID=2729599 RepID=A0A848IWX0_9BACT|nr:glycosyltransferase family 39 protein [Marinigracilibium pacificum]NMM47781.1 glycosyltransferase family 39 protein [Marinigracilibium pacificum]